MLGNEATRWKKYYYAHFWRYLLLFSRIYFVYLLVIIILLFKCVRGIVMGKKDKKVDAYIARQKPFAKPVLKHLRKVVHAGCPDVEEAMKWSFPCFVYSDSILCSMAGFKEHCTFGFWRVTELRKRGLVKPSGEKAMGQYGRIKKISDLPAETKLIKVVKEAAKINESGKRSPVKKKATARKKLVIPAYFTKALNKNKKAKETFDVFSYSNKKDFIEWITDAKTETTRAKRIDTTIKWLEEGKTRNWKYERKSKTKNQKRSLGKVR